MFLSPLRKHHQKSWSVLKEILTRKSSQNIHTCCSLSASETIRKVASNPIMDLQPYISIPIVPEGDMVFQPTEEEVTAGTQLFIPKPKHDIRFIKSVVDLEKLPYYKVPEVAFLGVSNVGKSSLIQAMFSKAIDAFNKVSVSKKPGHTRTLRFFQVGNSFSLVDMPGYGENMPHHYVSSVESYLQTRKKLVRSFLLINGETGIHEHDEIGIKMMEEFGIPYILVMTKIDKVSKSVLLKNLLSLMEYRKKKTHYCLAQPFMVSSVEGTGVALLQCYIAYVTGQIAIKES